MSSYKDLRVWQKSIDFVEQIYRITAAFPKTEQFNLVSQMQRCAVSIPSNIAEGHGRRSDSEFTRYLRIAFGSSSELETQVLIAHKLKILPKKEYDTLTTELVEIRKQLNTLIRSLSASNN